LQTSSVLARITAEIVRCRKCPRLVRHCAASAANPPRRYRGETYWGRPLPGFGDPNARLLLVGLAPAAHGGNRTGRMFTGDRSGDWLFDALHAAGFANQATSVRRGDGLELADAWITAALHCAPPLNKPATDELARCQPYVLAELRALSHVRVVVALGRIGWENYLRARKALGWAPSATRPVFGHGSQTKFPDGTTLLASYHPSQLARALPAQSCCYGYSARSPGRRGRSPTVSCSSRAWPSRDTVTRMRCPGLSAFTRAMYS